MEPLDPSLSPLAPMGRVALPALTGPPASDGMMRTLASELEQAHRTAVSAGMAGLQDAGLGRLRLSGPAVPALAEAAVSSAAPFLRAPLLSRLAGALRLHPAAGDADGRCPSCRVPSPCRTSRALRE